MAAHSHESDSLGTCASSSCLQPATVRMFHRLPGAMALVRTFCEEHAVSHEPFGWERDA